MEITEITNLPPISPISGVEYSQVWQWLITDETPVDLSLWTGQIVFSRGRTEVLSAPLVLTSDGEITLQLTTEQIEQINGPRVNYQINLLNPDGLTSEVWRGQCNVQ